MFVNEDINPELLISSTFAFLSSRIFAFSIVQSISKYFQRALYIFYESNSSV